jgi:hypothetical protein
LLNLPRARLFPRQRNLFYGSATLDLAVAARALVAVTAETIGSFAFPCCSYGGECCPGTGPEGRKATHGVKRPEGQFFSCCAHWRVHAWMEKSMKEGTLDLGASYLTRSTW